MITTDCQGRRISVTVFGEFTLADFKEFEAAADYRLKFEGEVDLLFDLREMADFTIDVAWEDLQYTKRHAGDFRRIAVVTDSQWLAWSAWLSNAFVVADLQVFSDLDAAESWLAS